MLDILQNDIANCLVKDGRSLRITETYYYDDTKGVRWVVEAGSVVDGASIPRIMWAVSGSPLVGLYRDASVVHDVHCQSRSRPYIETHNMFWDLMMASGVEEGKADKMWWAVMNFGPKWDENGNDIARDKEEQAFVDSVGEEW